MPQSQQLLRQDELISTAKQRCAVRFETIQRVMYCLQYCLVIAGLLATHCCRSLRHTLPKILQFLRI